MFEIKNRTPFRVALVPTLDVQGRDGAVVVVKATFALGRRGEALALAAEQVDIVRADAYRGEPGRSSLVHAAEGSPAKPATDVVLVGHAHAPLRPARELDVVLAVGPVKKTVRVFGDRRWVRGAAGLSPSEPASFAKMPLVWERAFGGVDERDADPAKRSSEARNPVGVGWGTADAPTDQPLPNLEDPRALVKSPKDRPPPAGLSFVCPDWLPRKRWAGTYDAAWQRDRFPLAPLDFDARFHQVAPADQQVAPHLVGGEPVVVQNASPTGDLSFPLPRRRLDVVAIVKGFVTHHDAPLDLVVIEPDAGRVTLTWRAAVECSRNLLHLETVRVAEVA